MENQDEFQDLSSTDPMEEVDSEIRQDIDALIHQGHLSKSFSFGGHSFVIRTLNAREGWAASASVKPYEGTLAEPRVYIAAVTGLSLVSYDGDTSFHVQLDNIDQHAIKRLNFVGAWDEIVLEHCYAHYLDLDRRRNRAREAIEDLSPRDRDNSLPSPDSSTEPDTFGEETPWVTLS